MKYLYLILVFCVCSCSSKNDQPKELPVDTTSKNITNNDSVVKKSDTCIEVAIAINKHDVKLLPNERLRIFRDAYLANYNELKNAVDAYHVLDRFTSEKSYKIYLEKKCSIHYGDVKDIFPLAQIRLYVYADSAQCANAINNWYNCFGKNCDQIQNEISTTIKSTPGFYIIDEKYILCLDYKLEHAENNWFEMIKNLELLFKTKKSTIIQVKPHGKLVWL